MTQNSIDQNVTGTETTTPAQETNVNPAANTTEATTTEATNTAAPAATPDRKVVNTNPRRSFGQHRNSSSDTPKWQSARDLHASGASTQVTVVSVAVKEGRPRGINVTLCELPCFVPGSEIPRGTNQAALVGQTISVKVIEVNRRKGILKASRSAVVVEEQKAFIATLQEGSEVEGVVARKADKLGYFIEIGPIDALLHVTQVPLSNGQPAELEIGSTVKARVRGIKADEGKVSLTMRTQRTDSDSNFGDRSRGRHGNEQSFGNRTSRKLEVPRIRATAPAQPAKPSAPRKLNTGTTKKRDGFQVAFSSQDSGNPFADLAAWYAQKGDTAPESATPETVGTPAEQVTAPVAE